MALKALTKGEDELSDLEHLTRATSRYWFDSYCLETLGRLPQEVYPLITCRTYTQLQALSIVKGAYAEVVQRHHAAHRNQPKSA